MPAAYFLKWSCFNDFASLAMVLLGLPLTYLGAWTFLYHGASYHLLSWITRRFTSILSVCLIIELWYFSTRDHYRYSVFAALQGNGGFSLGMLRGQNIPKSLLVAGLTGLDQPIRSAIRLIRKRASALISHLVFFLMATDWISNWSHDDANISNWGFLC